MKIRNERGGILVWILAVLWLMVFFLGIFAFFSYKAGLLRIEFGRKEAPAIVYDENTAQELYKREEIVSEKEKELKEKEAEIERLRSEISLEVQTIKKDREYIAGRVQAIAGYFEQFSEEEEDNLKQLARLYEPMKAAKVATIFNELDLETVAELLKRMKKRASAKILAEIGQMNAHRAAEISNIIQGKQKSDAFMNAGE